MAQKIFWEQIPIPDKIKRKTHLQNPQFCTCVLSNSRKLKCGSADCKLLIRSLKGDIFQISTMWKCHFFDRHYTCGYGNCGQPVAVVKCRFTDSSNRWWNDNARYLLVLKRAVSNGFNCIRNFNICFCSDICNKCLWWVYNKRVGIINFFVWNGVKWALKYPLYYLSNLLCWKTML